MIQGKERECPPLLEIVAIIDRRKVAIILWAFILFHIRF